MTEQRGLLDDDAAVEGLLRRAFTDDAAQAPAGDLRDLAASAAARGRAHRRRTAALTAALSVAAVAAIALGGTWAQARHDAVTPGGAHESAPSLPSATATPEVPTDGRRPVLMFRGAEVAVPAAMLDPDAVRCGTAVRDAAYVRDATLPTEACGIDIDQSDLTTVVFEPVEQVPADEKNAGSSTLDDGRYQVSSALPLSDVWFTVTSPDKARADRIFDSVLVLESPSGCPLHPEPAPTFGTGGSPLDVTVSAGSVGLVCGYRNGWVTGARVLSHEQTVQLAALVEAAPSDALLDCASGASSAGGWWVTLGESQVWVGDGCPQVVGASGGSGRLTSGLVSSLWSLASGPATFTDVMSPKG